MTTLDISGQKTAARLLAKYGKDMALKTAGAGVYDPATGEVTSAGVVSMFKGIIRTPEGTEVSNGFALTTDRIVTLQAGGLLAFPIPNDRLMIDADEYTVKQVRETWSGEKIVLFDLVVGK